MPDDDDLTIPAFLRMTEEERKKAWKKFKPKAAIQVNSDPRKPKSLSDEEWEQRKAEREEERRRAEEERDRQRKAARATAVPRIDITGKRWNQRKGAWEPDTLAHLAKPAPSGLQRPARQAKKAPGGKAKKVPAGSFGIPEGTFRDKLAKAMVKRLGELVPLSEWRKEVYGAKGGSDGACTNVINGFAWVIKNKKLKYEIIKDKNDKGQIVYGLYELE